MNATSAASGDGDNPNEEFPRDLDSAEMLPALTPEEVRAAGSEALRMHRVAERLIAIPAGLEREAERVKLLAAHEEALADRKAAAEPATRTPQERLDAAEARIRRESGRLSGPDADVDAVEAAMAAYHEAQQAIAANPVELPDNDYRT